MDARTVHFWKRYMVQNRLSARAVRTTAWIVAAWILGSLIALPVSEIMVTPHRGELSLSVHRWLSFAVHAALSVLTFFVVDATVLCVTFVRGLRRLDANWPDEVLQLFEGETGLRPGIHLDNWIDLQFLAMRTRVVSRLIYYPFLALSLLLLSRSPMFEDWDAPVGGIFMAANCAAIAFSCAVALRIAAERSRRQALQAIRDEQFRRARNAHDTDGRKRLLPTDQQLEMLEERVQHLSEGSFAPLLQQPLVRAVLLPVAAAGGTNLVELFALFGR